ncbi:MAG: DUF6285 domain-containing protein [Henriciella sp.]|jgi:hypothetical protein
MHNQPSVAELLQAVKSFIDETATPNLSGHAAFHARVASNVLGTALRDLADRPANDSAERGRLVALLTSLPEADLDSLNEILCQKIRNRELSSESPGLLNHLKQTTMAQLRVDQPHYSGLRTAENAGD